MPAHVEQSTSAIGNDREQEEYAGLSSHYTVQRYEVPSVADAYSPPSPLETVQVFVMEM